jgi:HEAT repeat protein
MTSAEDQDNVEYLLKRLASEDPRVRANTLNGIAANPTADRRLLAIAERLLDDRTICILSLPYKFGEVRWIAADAVAAVRAALSIDTPVVVDDVFAPVSTEEASKLAADAGLPTPMGGVEGVIQTLENLASMGRLPRRRITRS